MFPVSSIGNDISS
ncbi:hypothetical protein ECPA39_4340, partial [Escherichia coli PA39]